MLVYSIFVKGTCDIVSDEFKCHSKEVYTNKPSQEKIEEFIKKCSTGGFINLNINQPYDVQIIEHSVIEN